MASWNAANPTIKRVMKEHKGMLQKPCREFVAYPTDDNVLEWHFTMAGPSDSPYDGGLYHGRILIPGNYPFAPPDVVLLTPNGRFELDKKICLSISSYHPENWHPTWGISTVLLALREFMSTPGNNAIGAIEYPEENRRKLAKESMAWKCPKCGQKNADHHTELLAAPASEVPEVAKVQLPPPQKEGPATPSEGDASTPVVQPQAAHLSTTPEALPTAARGDTPPAAVEPLPAAERVDAAPAAGVGAAVAAAARAETPPPRRRVPPGTVEIQLSSTVINKLLLATFAGIAAILAKKALMGDLDFLMQYAPQ